MSWKQIPYPPDRDPLDPGEVRVAIAAGGLRLHVGSVTGRVVSLASEEVGLDPLADRRSGITFRLLDTEGVWIDGPAVLAASVERVGERAVEVTYERPRQCGVTFAVRLVLRYELIEDQQLGPAVACSYRLEHLGALPGENASARVERVQFPVIWGLAECFGDATELILPFIGGERRPRPITGGWRDFEYIYPNEAMSWMLYHDGTRGLYMASEDPAFRWTVMRGRVLRKRDPEAYELLFETTPFLGGAEQDRFIAGRACSDESDLTPPASGRYPSPLAERGCRKGATDRAPKAGVRSPAGAPHTRMDHSEMTLDGQAFESQRFVLWPYAGSWHRAADRYRAWLDTWWQPPQMPDSVRELRALVELFFEMPYADGRVVRSDADALYAFMERCWDEMRLDVAHICGYHRGGFDAQYPLYEPLDRIGGADGLREFAERCNAREGWTTDIYINCRITDVETDWWGRMGREWACRSKDGTFFTEFYNGRYFTVACPFPEERQDYWLAKIEEITRGYGVEGLQVDQPHTTARECWSREAHGHRTPFDHWGPGYIELFRRIREQLTEREPRVWSWGEAASDVFSQFFDFSCCYVRYPDQKVAFGETDPATRDWVSDWRGYGMPEVFRYCCPEVPMLQCPRVTAENVEELYTRLHILFMFSPMLYWPSLSIEYDLDRVDPGFRAYLTRLWDLRQELRDTMIHGRFRDIVGLGCSNASVYAKLYVSGPGRRPGITAIAINRDPKAEQEVTLRIDPAALMPEHASAAWSWRERALPAAQSGARTVATVSVLANRVAVVHFEPRG